MSAVVHEDDDLRAEVRLAAEAVADPELPVMTLGSLGVVHAVAVRAGRVEIELLPTYAGCPAQDIMAQDVRAAVEALAGVASVEVRFILDPMWTAEQMTAEGHRALPTFGIAPPRCGTERTVGPVPCPYCSSTETDRDSMFGPTPCREMWFCRACSQPFEAFKG